MLSPRKSDDNPRVHHQQAVFWSGRADVVGVHAAVEDVPLPPCAEQVNTVGSISSGSITAARRRG
jgi:hypothetical protein